MPTESVMATQADLRRDLDCRPAVDSMNAVGRPARFLCGCRDCAFSSEEWMRADLHAGRIRIAACQAQPPYRSAAFVPEVGSQATDP